MALSGDEIEVTAHFAAVVKSATTYTNFYAFWSPLARAVFRKWSWWKRLTGALDPLNVLNRSRLADDTAELAKPIAL